MKLNRKDIFSEDIQEDNNKELEKISKSQNIENIYHFLNICWNFVCKVITFLIRVSGVYFLWICLHYFSAHIYINFCVPSTFIGFIMSPFMVSTPHCQGLRWIVYNAASIINNMWILIGAWIYSIIWIYKENHSEDSNGL
jgi:hypothetical protein